MKKVRIMFSTYAGEILSQRLTLKYGEGIYANFYVFDDDLNDGTKNAIVMGDIVTIKIERDFQESLQYLDETLNVQNVGKAVMISRYIKYNS